MSKRLVILTALTLAGMGCKKAKDHAQMIPSPQSQAIPAQDSSPAAPSVGFQDPNRRAQPNQDSNADTKRVLQTIEDVNRVNQLNRDQAPKKQ